MLEARVPKDRRAAEARPTRFTFPHLSLKHNPFPLPLTIQLRSDERARLLAALTSWPLPVTGSGGYAHAEVTGGGVALSQIKENTCESRSHPGLFLVGELLDCYGRIGGFNFNIAWVTGRLAGVGAAAAAAAAAAATAAAQSTADSRNGSASAIKAGAVASSAR